MIRLGVRGPIAGGQRTWSRVLVSVKHAVGPGFFSGRSAKCAALHPGVVVRIKEIVVLIFGHSAEKTGVIIRTETGPRLVAVAMVVTAASRDIRD
jgi:hypothetical protein